MTRDEAKLLLQAVRPDGGDAADPAFAEALALAQSDPELRAWWEARQNFDRAIAARLDEIPAPLSLRDRILGQRKVVPFTERPYLSALFAAAAALLLIGVVQTLLYTGQPPNPAILNDAYTASVLSDLGDDKPALDMTSPDRAKVLAWLKERHAPTGAFPVKLAALPSVGCQVFEVRGHAVTLICFALSGGGLAHLFIVDKRALMDPPGDLPEYDQNDGWSTAAWSDDEKSYVLATRAGPEALRALL